MEFAVTFCFYRTINHCPFCNLCRVGRGLGVDYFHCMSCNCCLSLRLLKHECKEKCLETSCPVCNEFLFTSTTTVRALSCGHYIHSTCFEANIVTTSLSLYAKISLINVTYLSIGHSLTHGFIISC